MREIKFRGKSLETGEWVFGDFSSPCHICFFEVGYDAVLKKDGVRIFDEHQVDEETIGQFMDLKTLTGKRSSRAIF